MQCQTHQSKKATSKCVTCLKYLCTQCSKLHQLQRHQIVTSIQLAEIIKCKISQQMTKMNDKISELVYLRDYQAGESVIDGCMNQLQIFITNLFAQIKLQYRNITDSSWKLENIDKINDIQHKKSILEQLNQSLRKRPDQATIFNAENIYEQNKLDSDQQLIDSSESYILGNMAPKIVFNQTALRRSYESLTKIIFTQNKNRISIPKKIKKATSKKSVNSNTPKYVSLCKFVEGTNILFQYIVQDPQNFQNENSLLKIEFRQFTAPLRSVSIVVGTNIYIIGGYNKQNKPRRQIYYYQRSLNSVRIIGQTKQGRVGHAVCSNNEIIYIFGGKYCKSLQSFNTQTKQVQIISTIKQQIIGASMIAFGNKLYIFGGTNGIQLNKVLYCYDIGEKKWQNLAVNNNDIYSMPISPILQALNQTEILIYGGYYTFGGQSYNNSYMITFNTKLNYFSVYGKGQLIYPILSNGPNSTIKDNKIISLAQLKRQRNKHGPNLPVLFFFGISDELMQIDVIAI